MSASELLATVLDRPEDDTPRLVYADWLEEHDDQPRAEFIRTQCELERLSPGDPRYPALEQRADDLLIQHE